MFEAGQKVRHKKTGEVAVFKREYSNTRGRVKVLTSGPWGPIDVDMIEMHEEPDPPPPWPLKTSPEAYLKKYGDDGPKSELAKMHLE